MKYVPLFVALVASGVYAQVEVTKLEQAAPDHVTVVDCPAVFTVPISLTGTGRNKGASWSLEDHRCQGFEGLMIGSGALVAKKRGGLRLLIRAHLEPSFDRLMRGRVDLLGGDKSVLISQEFTMEVEEDQWNNKWLKLGPIEDVSSITSLALAVYSIQED